MSSWLWIKGIGRPRVSYCGGLLSLTPGWMVSYVFGVGGSPSPVLSAVLLKSVECSILPTCALPGLSPSSCYLMSVRAFFDLLLPIPFLPPPPIPHLHSPSSPLPQSPQPLQLPLRSSSFSVPTLPTSLCLSPNLTRPRTRNGNHYE